MNALTRHPCRQGLTYFEHLVFAMGIAWRLSSSVTVFALHALLPFISIQPRLDLEATSTFLMERNHFVESAAATAHTHANPARASLKPGRRNTPAMA